MIFLKPKFQIRKILIQFKLITIIFDCEKHVFYILIGFLKIICAQNPLFIRFSIVLKRIYQDIQV